MIQKGDIVVQIGNKRLNGDDIDYSKTLPMQPLIVQEVFNEFYNEPTIRLEGCDYVHSLDIFEKIGEL